MTSEKEERRAKKMMHDSERKKKKLLKKEDEEMQLSSFGLSAKKSRRGRREDIGKKATFLSLSTLLLSNAVIQ